MESVERSVLGMTPVRETDAGVPGVLAAHLGTSGQAFEQTVAQL